MKFKFFNKPKVERVEIDESKYPAPKKVDKVEHPPKEELDKLWKNSSVSNIDKGESLDKMTKEN